MVVRTAAGRMVVRFVLALIPWAEAVIKVVPPFGPPAPTASPALLMVATLRLLLLKLKVIPLIEFPY